MRIPSRVLVVTLVICVMTYPPRSSAQKPGSQGQNTQGAPQNASSPSLQGLSWPQATWDRDLGLPPGLEKNGTVLACYTLAYGNSSTQPLLLKPANSYDERTKFSAECEADANGNLKEKGSTKKRCELARQQKITELKWEVEKDKFSGLDTKQAQAKVDQAKKSGFKGVRWSYCKTLDSEHPILMGQTLVIGIDIDSALSERVKILNINLTNQQGNPINPTPVRASFGNSATTATNAGVGPYYLTWPNEIPGDSIPTVNVNVVYTPPMPGDKWQPGTFYPAGIVVADPNGNGHYYTASSGGVSAANANDRPLFPAPGIQQIFDGTARWVDNGNTQPQSGGPGSAGATGSSGFALWIPASSYSRNQVIFNPYNGHYYSNLAVGNATCTQSVPPNTCVQTSGPPTDPFSVPTPTIADGTVTWADQGTDPPPVPAPAARVAGANYGNGVYVQSPDGHYYKAVQAGGGVAGMGPSPFPIVAVPGVVTDGGVVWGMNDNVAAAGLPSWSPNTKYLKGKSVRGSNGHIYTAGTLVGISGAIPTQPYFATTPAFSEVTETTTSVLASSNVSPGSNVVVSVPSTVGFSVGSYVALGTGDSEELSQIGSIEPGKSITLLSVAHKHETPFPVTQNQEGLNIRWEDIGTTPPASVASGQPPDQVVSLLNFQYAQSHSLSYYNLASGVMYSWAKSRSFGFQPAGCSNSAGSTTPCVPTQIGSSRTVDPVLLFTVYPKPWDSESRCPGNWCLGRFKTNPPGLSFGLSLSSPSSSFYAGASFEILRNLQVVVAANFAKEAMLAPTSTSQPSSATMSGTPVTVQKFTTAPSVGLTLNILGFVQSLFGGGGGGAGKGGGTASPSGSTSSP
jgi:hypothetical protein